MSEQAKKTEAEAVAEIAEKIPRGQLVAIGEAPVRHVLVTTKGAELSSVKDLLD
jgi:hypothetical protein